MAKERIPSTPAIRMLKEHGVDFTVRPYKYEERGGTRIAARELGINEHSAVKTIVMEDDGEHPFIVLMHGDKEISTKTMARILESKTVTPCNPQTALKHTGYVVGGTSPFGTKKTLPTYVEKTILDLPKIFINGGKRGLLVEMSPGDLVSILNPKAVSVGY
ncbi:MAG: Cys-tRNA(Pro) deacylase [Deltaproteobacteria bacterium]|nr:Cys-tRNA(Pro) deacylase [Deltaproteobacteria bacterium]MBN2686541.1 Cys-tRNA(Pro) deacylase [Deltaproteobacteria bacterium]